MAKKGQTRLYRISPIESGASPTADVNVDLQTSSLGPGPDSPAPVAYGTKRTSAASWFGKSETGQVVQSSWRRAPALGATRCSLPRVPPWWTSYRWWIALLASI